MPKSEDLASTAVAAFETIHHMSLSCLVGTGLLMHLSVILPYICCIAVKCFSVWNVLQQKHPPCLWDWKDILCRSRALNFSNCIWIKRQKSDYSKIKMNTCSLWFQKVSMMDENISVIVFWFRCLTIGKLVVCGLPFVTHVPGGGKPNFH